MAATMQRTSKLSAKNSPGAIRAWRFALGILVSTACGINDQGSLPPDIQDPATVQTPAGALARYRTALASLPAAFDGAMLLSGLLSDELTTVPTALGTSGVYTNLNSRTTPGDFGQYNRFHRLRAQAREARGFLAAYTPDSSPALQGQLYAAEAYAELFLADLFCSGIPLSTVDFNANYTLATGSSTADVYRHAVALFDTARTLASDSVAVQYLAAVGRGRALLALGRYAEAKEAVTAVPGDFAYRITFTFGVSNLVTIASDSAALWFYQQNPGLPAAISMANREGSTGLDYLASNDPRTLSSSSGDVAFPSKYATTSPVMFTIASGIEARLIVAEAMLQAQPNDGQWLDTLNQLRQTAGLADTTDPGTAAGRVNLVFRERAFWLYLTGQRQGDLRRLAREYLRDPESIYPRGVYPGGTGAYGVEVVIPVPGEERRLNPKYTGCIHSNA